MQTHKWNINEVPPEYIKPINSWKSQNFNYVYYSNIDAYNYLLKHFGKHYADIFDTINIGAFKADFFRYCWIYTEGGIYADADSMCLMDIEKWLEEYKDVDVILTRDDPTNKRAFYQAFIYSKKPYNKLFKACIEIIVDNIQKYRMGERFDDFDFTSSQ
jgi:mannosyltransferase OCH1-like enzyme